MTDRIPVASPWITEREIAAVTEAARTGWRGRAHHYQTEFENALAAYCDRRYGLSLPSCTSGLHLALAALGIGPGDEVIVPELTWIATSSPISYVGATPIFADVDPRSWCVSVDSIEQSITKRTKAIIAVDLYGDMPDWQAIDAVARNHDIAVIEDAAEAVGARYNNRAAGSFGVASAFSFHGSKTLTTGEGGMLLYDNEHFHARCSQLRDHGRRPGDIMFFNEEVGFKYRMSGLQAALGLAQLERVDELVARKCEIFGWYSALLTGQPGISLNRTTPNVQNGYWMVTVLLDPDLGWTKEQLVPAMRAAGIDVRPLFYPLSQLPAYRDSVSGRDAARRNKTAYEISPYGLNLPSGPDIDRQSVERAVKVLLGILASRPI